MTNFYVLTIEGVPEKLYFTSIIAIFEEYDYDTLKVKYNTMRNYSFNRGAIYKNKSITIERVTAYSKEDIIQRKKNKGLQ